MSSPPDDPVEYDDVDDIIGIAERLREKARSELTLEELREVGAEVGIPAEYIDRAHESLQAQRERDKIETIRRRNGRKRMLYVLGGALLLILVIAAISYLTVTSRLHDLYAEVERHQAEVANVKARQASIHEQYKDLPDSIDKQAEMVGAENRVRVATQRFNEAAARYNRAVRLPPASMYTGGSLPTMVELDHGGASRD